jgi:transketolase
LLTGDLGFNVLEPFADRFPERFVNAGVAEQNMLGVAAGLASCGKIVFAYSIGNFNTLRCLEQIRNDVCYHGLSVTVVSVGGGYAYGALGASHHATEDLAIMRSLPCMTVLAPGDSIETRLATKAITENPGPYYLRLGKAGEASVYKEQPRFQIGRAVEVRNGSDLTLIACGSVLDMTMKVANQLDDRGISARVISMHTVSPLDAESVLAAARQTKIILTLEEHSVSGGLGGAVAEVLAEAGISGVSFRRLGLPTQFCHCCGTQDYLLGTNGLSDIKILTCIEDLMRRP